MMVLVVLLLDDYGWPCYYAGRHPESSTRRTEYVVVMVVRVRARRRWSRLLDWMWIGRRDDTDMTNRPAEEVRLGGGSDEE